jgi:hypothetical protein
LARLPERKRFQPRSKRRAPPDRESATFVPIESSPVPHGNTRKEASAKKLCLSIVGCAGCFQRLAMICLEIAAIVLLADQART